jgi:predicted lysophospholipase L1 biosynthesis ABC-type transport system permease subunit
VITSRLFPRIVFRNWARLALAGVSLTIGALTLSTVLGLVGSVREFFVLESRTLLGGDIIVDGDAPFAATHRFSRNSLHAVWYSPNALIPSLLRNPTFRRFPGRLTSLLTSLKVVDDAYPLYGTLKTRLDGKTVPGKSEVFVAPDVLERMGIVIGDTLVIGKERFMIANVVEKEPDRVGGNFRLGPLIVMSQNGWSQTGIDGKQSRARYTLSIRSPPHPDITEKESSAIIARLNEEFPRPNYRVAIAKDGPPSLLRILELAEQFFVAVIVLALFLVVVNIRVNLVYVLASYQKTIAVLRAFGIRRSQLFALFFLCSRFLPFLRDSSGASQGPSPRISLFQSPNSLSEVRSRQSLLSQMSTLSSDLRSFCACFPRSDSLHESRKSSQRCSSWGTAPHVADLELFFASFRRSSLRSSVFWGEFILSRKTRRSPERQWRRL